jgi:RNA polymerase sigma factor (sigma-70 family)
MNSNITPQASPDQQPNKVQELQKAFSSAVSKLLLPNNPEGTAFLNFVCHYLYVWNIRDIDPKDIISEAVFRGLRFIHLNHQPIKVPKAWLRGTCLNVMKDQVDETVHNDQRSRSLKECSYETESPLTIAERLEFLDKFYEALDRLEPNDKDLVQLRLIEDKSYEQIHYWLKVRDGQAPEIPTIRKRYSRALTHLKDVFSMVYQD